MTATAVKSSFEVRVFLEGVFAGKPEELFILLWTLPEKQSHWFQDVESAVQFAESMSEYDLYVDVGLSSQNYGATRRCTSDEVAGMVGLWADLDLKSDALKFFCARDFGQTVTDARIMLEERMLILPQN